MTYYCYCGDVLMIYALSGLLFGLLIPYMSRRFAKFMPATLAYALYRIVKPVRRVSAAKRHGSWQYTKMMSQYRWRSVMWGILTAALSYGAFYEWGSQLIWWKLIFIWLLLLSAEIDFRLLLLPDILTIPLLLLGFAFSAWTGLWTMPYDSSLAALFGYFVPALISLLFVWKNKDAFGGGDVKLLAAAGAWLGVEKLLYTIVGACILFALYVAIMRKRQGAFGPAISAAAIAVAFYYF